MPDVELPESLEYEIGVWDNRCRQYLKQHHRIEYYNIFIQASFILTLPDIEQQVQRLYLKLIEDFSKAEGVTGKLTGKLKERHSML